MRLSRNKIKTVLVCGASGGLAATFNAPMGGAMFASEIIVGEFTLKTFSPIIVYSVIATVISRAYFGNNVTFEAYLYHFINPIELIFYAILGFFTALIGVYFIKIFYNSDEYFERLKIPNYLKPALGGLLLGILALFSRRILGVGYTTIVDILNGNLTLITLLLMIVFKIVATLFSLASGGSGGVFVPSLFIGAATGGFFGNLLYYISNCCRWKWCLCSSCN